MEFVRPAAPAAIKPAPDESGVPCWQLSSLVKRLIMVSRFNGAEDLAHACGLDPSDVRKIFRNTELWIGLRKVEILLEALDAAPYLDERYGYLTFVPSNRRCHAVAMASYEALNDVEPDDEARVLAERQEWIQARADELAELRLDLLTDPRVSDEAYRSLERDRLRKNRRTALAAA